jgi:hypothetical protein
MTLLFIAAFLRAPAPAPTRAPLDGHVIVKILGRASHPLSACGTLGPIEFTIEADGSVKEAGGDACVQRVLKKLRFPAPGERVHVSYPLATDPV